RRQKAEGSLLYKTGDLARYLPDGNIEFLGRIDNQVKLRGFRIELAEIEAQLSQHPGVKQNVVVVREDLPTQQRLVAYIVSHQHYSPSVTELRSFLKQTLPDYMVPSVFIQLDALPLLPNGKVDHKSLPIPDTNRPELAGDFVAPRNFIEEKLVQIWGEVLRIENIGIYDNFFELGGDSILSLQVIAKANQADLQLTPKQIFEYQNIAELAGVVNTTTVLQAEQGIVTGSLPLTPIQHWFFEQELPEPNHWNQAVMLEVPPTSDPSLWEQVVQKLLAHHDALRSRFVQTAFGWDASHAAPEQTAPFSVVDLSKLPENQQAEAIEATAASLQSSLNLSTGPLLRVVLFQLGRQQPSRLLTIIHHLVVDGVSWRILLEDLQTAYLQLSQGQEIQLAAKTTSFKQWAESLREYAQSRLVQSELDYWLSQPHKQISLLPVDLNGENTEASAASISVALTPQETQALLQEVPSAYQTQINDVLLTALVQAFYQWTGNNTLLVDLEGHGREDIIDRVDLSRTVGWFTTIFPVVLDLGQTVEPGEALKTIKEQLRSIPNRGINYSILRYLSNDERLESLPQAEVKFNYLGQFDLVLSESSIFRPAQESTGPMHSQQGNRNCLLEVNGLIVGGQLRLDWTY
ncbi:MAG TPA: non-ribosomal peptide synthetase, partial [Cyanobacteria bacterium UBA11049]|nr:non-ribosomal peptide synthetase [Cyanobacteria bacterium UBA11049]